MTPYEIARQWYEDHPQPFTFSHYLIENALHGFVFITPDFFIMGYPKPDCWHVVFASGDLSKAWSILPYHLPYISFERVRDGKLDLTVMPIERMRKLSEIAAL